MSPSPNSGNGTTPLVVFFVMVYTTSGLLDYNNGLLVQPVSNYLKSIGMDASQVSMYLFALALPWLITPVYTIIADFIPILGSRRKAYLHLFNFVAVAAALFLSRIDRAEEIIFALVASALSTAAVTTLCGAVMVEASKKYHAAGKFVNIQWTCYYLGLAVAGIIGGLLTQHLSPKGALHTVALLTMLPPLVILGGTYFLLPAEPRAQVDMKGLRKSVGTLGATFKVKGLWLIALFLIFYNFAPGFQTPLYFHMSDNLKFEQQFIGYVLAATAIGGVLGGAVCVVLEKLFSLKTMLYLSIAGGVIAQASYLFLAGEVSAIILALSYGLTCMVSLVGALALAADLCPDGSEGFAYAILASIGNLSYQISDKIGSWMFESVFHHNLTPLIIMTSLFTLMAASFLPFLKPAKSS